MDLAGYEDVDEFMGEVDDPLVELSQDVYHRMVEPFGSNLDVPADASLGLEDILHGTYDGTLPSIVENGLSLDERIDAVKATVTDVEGTASSTGARSLRMDVEIVVDEQELGITLESDGDVLRRVT